MGEYLPTFSSTLKSADFRLSDDNLVATFDSPDEKSGSIAVSLQNSFCSNESSYLEFEFTDLTYKSDSANFILVGLICPDDFKFDIVSEDSDAKPISPGLQPNSLGLIFAQHMVSDILLDNDQCAKVQYCPVGLGVIRPKTLSQPISQELQQQIDSCTAPFLLRIVNTEGNALN